MTVIGVPLLKYYVIGLDISCSNVLAESELLTFLHLTYSHPLSWG